MRQIVTSAFKQETVKAVVQALTAIKSLHGVGTERSRVTIRHH